jgi:hypothetical protein
MVKVVLHQFESLLHKFVVVSNQFVEIVGHPLSQKVFLVKLKDFGYLNHFVSLYAAQPVFLAMILGHRNAQQIGHLSLRDECVTPVLPYGFP